MLSPWMERYDKARQHIEKQRYYFADKSSHIQIVSHSAMSNSLRPHGVWPVSLLCPWNSSGKNTGVGSHFFLQVKHYKSLNGQSKIGAK